MDSDEGLNAEVMGIDGEMCVDLFDEQPQKKMLFLSSGIGITPFLCIARGLATAHNAGVGKCNLDVLMIHSTRGLDAMPYLEELRSIALDSAGWPVQCRSPDRGGARHYRASCVHLWCSGLHNS